MDGKVSMVFNRNCFPKMKYFSRLGDLQACSHVHRKSGSIKEMSQTNMKYHMTYLFVSFPMTLDDLEGHSRDQDLSNAIRRRFVRHLARF